MKRSSSAVGKAVKARLWNTVTLKRRKTPKPSERANPSGLGQEAEVARLTRELNEERNKRIATSEILRLLSGSHGDLSRLFDTILANATNLCQANFGTLSLYQGDAFRIAAMHNVPPAFAELRRTRTVGPNAVHVAHGRD